MKHFTKALSLLLALTMLLGMMPLQALANETEPNIADDALDEQVETAQEPEEVEEAKAPAEEAKEPEVPEEEMPEAVAFSHVLGAYWVNPLYEDIVTEEPMVPAQRPMPRSNPNFVSLDRAADDLKFEMTIRTDEVEIYCYAPNEPGLSDSDFELYLNYIWETVLFGAMAHSTSPGGGDYLANHLTDATGAISYDDSDPETLYLLLTFELEYLTNYDQECAVDAAAEEFISSFNAEKPFGTEYEKVFAIYTFLTEQVAFDQAGLNNTWDTRKNTAYGALVEESAVGPGFASAFYYLALKAGLDTRIVVDEDGHAWNIVRINGVYYHLDAAWDAKRVQAGQEWAYFLKSNASIAADHSPMEIYTSAEFQELYPPAKEDYNDEYLTAGEYNGIRWVLTADGVLTVSGSGMIPSEYDMDELPNRWHKYNGMTQRIVIEEGITSIGRAAFSYSNAVSISLPSSLRQIGIESFKDCRELREVVIPASVKTIDSSAFSYCELLERVVFEARSEENQLELDRWAFGFCPSLKQITLPDNTDVGMGVFEQSGLEKVTFGKNTTLDYDVFLNCASLHTVEFSEDMKVGGSGLFKGCKSLKTVVLPNGFESINGTMFSECTGLVEIVIPASVSSIGYEAFLNCTNLRKIVFMGQPPTIWDDSFYGVTATAYYPTNRSGWTEDVRQNYGGQITWVGQEVEIEKFDIAFANMTLGNSLAMNFAFPQDGTDNWEGAYAQIAKTYADGRGTKLINIPISQWGQATINGKAYYTLKFNGIAAKEMADEIYITVYNGDRKPISNNWEDSVRSYAMRTLNNPNTAPESLTMIVDLLNYGAAAQLSFGYDVENLANNKLTEQQAALATPSAWAEDSRVAGENYLGTQLRLESQIMLRMAFSNVTADMTAQVSFTDHYDRPQSYTIPGSSFEISGNTAVVTIDKIVVADARKDVTVQIIDGDSNVVASATDSVAGYIARMRQEEEDPLYESILKFADSAYLYFHPGAQLPQPPAPPAPEHSEFYVEGLSQDQAVAYFNEVCFGSEYGTNTPYIRKWTQPITYAVYGDPTAADTAALESFVDQLNSMEGFPGLIATDDSQVPVLEIHFCEEEEMAGVVGDWASGGGFEGAVTIHYNGACQITNAGIAIRVDLDQHTRTSVILEEIYNGLGPLMDTVDRTDSIIYQYGSSVTELSDVDWLILQLLYSEAVLPGMDKTECEAVLRSLYW